MNKEIQQRLRDFEAAPPAMLWDKISSGLDAGEHLQYASRLYAFEAVPSQNNWEQIEQALDQQVMFPAPPVRNRNVLYRYLTAAAVLLLILFSANRYFKSSPPENELASPSSLPVQKNEMVVPPVIIPDEEKSAETSTASISKRTAAPAENSRSRVLTKMPLLKVEPSTSFAGSVMNRKEGPTLKHDLLDRYIVFSKQTGEAVRLSKKMFSFFNCPDFSEDCRQKIASAQQQIASPSLMAATDFSGVLDLLQTTKVQ